MTSKEPCLYCKDNGADRVCTGCYRSYHTSCARQQGDLEVINRSGGVVTASVVEYQWECPNCERSVRKKV